MYATLWQYAETADDVDRGDLEMDCTQCGVTALVTITEHWDNPHEGELQWTCPECGGRCTERIDPDDFGGDI